MNLQFLNWHNLKCTLSESKNHPFFQEREIWFAFVGKNIGFEQDGKGEKFLRPVVVLKKFNNDLLWALPLTGSKKQGIFYHTVYNTRQISSAILSQIRVIDAKRLLYKMAILSDSDFVIIKQKLRQFLA